ncbi:MAG: efflux RND transporter periplasmic adaptor subunit [Rhodothermales bacterium]|nr:efflux RND transporter periplasmic adaptor subunit [Rhodothermales bacterium]
MRAVESTAVVLLLSLLSYSNAGCSGEAQSKSPEEEKAEETTIPVEAVSASRGTISAYYTGTASLEAEEEASVATKAGGVVTELFVEEGQYVKAGQPLAKLDGERLALELARTEVNLNKLKREHLRNEGLYEKQLISVEEYERIRSDFEAQQAAYNLAKLELDYTMITAPIAGIIAQRFIKIGHSLRVGDPAFHISDFDPLLAVMHAPERELGKLRVGQEARLGVDAMSGSVFTGSIKRISPIVDPATGTFKVTIEVRDASRQLKPGMFGRIQIVYDTRDNALLVPKEAVIVEDEVASVYVVRNSEAFRLDIERGYGDTQHYEILAGLAEGDTVITAGQSSLRDSSKVEVIWQ